MNLVYVVVEHAVFEQNQIKLNESFANSKAGKLKLQLNVSTTFQSVKLKYR